VPGGREHRHVGADLGNDRLRGPLAHPGDGVQPVSSPGERGEHPVDVGIELGDRPLKLLQVRHGQADQQRMMGTKAAPQGLAQLRELGAQPPLGQLSQHLWVALAGDQRLQHRATRGAQHVGGDRVQLDAGVLQRLLDALALGGVGLDEPLTVAVRSRSSRIGAGGTKLPPSSPCSNSSASQAASHTSVLRPGRSLTWRALTNSSRKPRPSSTYQTGFQLLAGGLHHHLVTPSAASHPASASSPR
jgi:hypothetical protein